MRSLFCAAVLIGYQASAQPPLPLYERWDDHSLLISRDPSAFDSLDRTIDTVTAFGPNGAEFLAVVGTHTVHVDECCNDVDPEFLLLEMENPVVRDMAYKLFFLGAVAQLRPWLARPVPLDSIWRDTLTFRDPEERRSLFFFAPDSISGNGLTYRQYDRYTGEHYDRTFATPRPNCIARALDDFTCVRCARDTSLKAIIWGANALFLFDHGEPVLQFWDWSGTSSDGYGPFAYSYYDVCAVLPYGTGRAYMLTSGEVVYHDGDRWIIAAREPVLYYGECDCGEE